MAEDLILIQNMIYEVRGQKVMLDSDLAQLYGVETRYLNKSVKRNAMRFPPDFMFQLTQDEWENLMFQIGTSSLKSQGVNSSWGGRRKLPYVFTEQGIAMLSSVLNSGRAVATNTETDKINQAIDLLMDRTKPAKVGFNMKHEGGVR